MGSAAMSEDIWISLREFTFKSYFCNAWNYLDWIHMGLMAYGWILRLYCVNTWKSFKMPERFPLLVNPLATNPARLFLVNSTEEYHFLDFASKLQGMRNTLDLYDGITSFCGNSILSEFISHIPDLQLLCSSALHLPFFLQEANFNQKLLL